MARSRNIKPSFFDNDELAENSPLGRLLFIGLWTLADYKGNFIWREKRIKAKLLPYDDCDIKKIAINLDKSGFIRFYSDGDEIYCNITNFSKHQNPHKNERAKGSEIPEYSEESRQVIDLKGLTINRDKSRQERESSHSDRADSLNPIPDSLNPIPSNRDAIAFDQFWEIWPKKIGRADAEKKWAKIKPNTELFAKIYDHLINRHAYAQTEKQFIPNPSTYLNQERWNDEVVAPAQNRQAKQNNIGSIESLYEYGEDDDFFEQQGPGDFIEGEIL